MRGAEGLSGAAINSVFTAGKQVYFNHYYNGEYRLSTIHMKVITSFPEEGRIQINLMKNIGTNKFHFFIPMGINKATVSLTLQGVPLEYAWEGGFLAAELTGCGEIILTFDITLYKKSRVSKNPSVGNVTFWHGILLLGVKTDKIIHIDGDVAVYCGNGVYKVGDARLEPINRSIYKERKTLTEEKLQLLFD
jgi:hypothetical protein